MRVIRELLMVSGGKSNCFSKQESTGSFLFPVSILLLLTKSKAIDIILSLWRPWCNG